MEAPALYQLLRYVARHDEDLHLDEIWPPSFKGCRVPWLGQCTYHGVDMPASGTLTLSARSYRKPILTLRPYYFLWIKS